MFRGRRFQYGFYPGYDPNEPVEHLLAYHALVFMEMKSRHYNIDPLWESGCYRGKNCEPWNSFDRGLVEHLYSNAHEIFPQSQTEAYCQDCKRLIRDRTASRLYGMQSPLILH
jgi:uncharacterized protein (TIGR02328 family)